MDILVGELRAGRQKRSMERVLQVGTLTDGCNEAAYKSKEVGRQPFPERERRPTTRSNQSFNPGGDRTSLAQRNGGHIFLSK